MRTMQSLIIVGGLSLTWAGLAVAQAPPGPLQPAPRSVSENEPPPPPIRKVAPRKSIMGDWKLNRDDSDDPRSKMHRASANRGNNGSGQSGPRVGWPGGGGGMGGPGYGGNRHPEADTASESNEKIQTLIDPSVRVHLEQADPKGPKVELTGDQGKKMVFYTDGKTPEKSTDPNLQQITARWDGAKLVTDEKIEKKGTLSRSYELSEDGMQLFEEVHVTTGKKNDYPVTIRFVYDAVNVDDGRY